MVCAQHNSWSQAANQPYRRVNQLIIILQLKPSRLFFCFEAAMAVFMQKITEKVHFLAVFGLGRISRFYQGFEEIFTKSIQNVKI